MFVRVHVVPGAKKEQLFKISDTEFDITVREPAERNLANQRVREMIAAEFGVSWKTVRIISGHQSPTKMLSFDV